jgi:N-methylhydantoinase B
MNSIAKTSASAPRPADFDPITLEIINHDLVSIPNQIDKNITRTAFSPLINEYKDYAVGIVDADGRLISQSRGSLLIFVANALGTAVADGIALFGKDDLKDGDVIISNHAGTLGQHLNNVVMYTPVRVGSDKQLVGFFCVLMHWIDVGGMQEGSCTSTVSTEIWQEGIQFRSVRLIEEGKRRADMFRMIEYNTRFPDMLLGDVEAQIGGCMLGREMLGDLCDKYGADAFSAAVETMWQRSERSVRAAVAAAPDGCYEASSFLDGDGISDDPVAIGIKVKIQGEELTVDLSGVADQLPGPLNAGRNGGAVAAARIAMKYLFSPDDPVNDGDFRNLEVVIPDGKFLSARPNAPIGGSGNMIPTVVDTILRALAPAFPERVAAAHHGTYGIHVFSGTSPLTGESFLHIDTCIGGWGASAAGDGYGPSRSNIHGDTPEVPVELQEAFHPYRFEAYRLRENSGGTGRHRGGLGVEKVYRILEPCRIILNIDRTKCPPWGLAGGSDGVPGDLEIQRVDGTVEQHLKGNHMLATGDRVIIRSAGGGGFGNLADRAPDLVARDRAFGYVAA